MRLLTLSVLTLGLLVTGCDSGGPHVLQWEGALVGQSGYDDVSGTVTVTSQPTNAAASINISGSVSGSIHPWGIYVGTCESGGPVLGSLEAYRLLQVGPDGTASTSVLISESLSASQSYFVQLHASPEDTATIVACGNLVLLS